MEEQEHAQIYTSDLVAHEDEMGETAPHVMGLLQQHVEVDDEVGLMYVLQKYDADERDEVESL